MLIKLTYLDTSTQFLENTDREPMNIEQLQAQLRRRGLSTKGKKANLNERLEVGSQLLDFGLDASGDDNAVLVARLKEATNAVGLSRARKRAKTLSTELEALDTTQNIAVAAAIAEVGATRDKVCASHTSELGKLQASHDAAAKKHHEAIELHRAELRALTEKMAVANTEHKKLVEQVDLNSKFVEKQKKAETKIIASFESQRRQLIDGIAYAQMIFEVSCEGCGTKIDPELLQACGSCDEKTCKACSGWCAVCEKCCKICMEAEDRMCTCGTGCEAENRGVCENCADDACDQCECIHAYGVQEISSRSGRTACEQCRKDGDCNDDY